MIVSVNPDLLRRDPLRALAMLRAQEYGAQLAGTAQPSWWRPAVTAALFWVWQRPGLEEGLSPETLRELTRQWHDKSRLGSLRNDAHDQLARMIETSAPSSEVWGTRFSGLGSSLLIATLLRRSPLSVSELAELGVDDSMHGPLRTTFHGGYSGPGVFGSVARWAPRPVEVLLEMTGRLEAGRGLKTTISNQTVAELMRRELGDDELARCADAWRQRLGTKVESYSAQVMALRPNETRPELLPEAWREHRPRARWTKAMGEVLGKSTHPLARQLRNDDLKLLQEDSAAQVASRIRSELITETLAQISINPQLSLRRQITLFEELVGVCSEASLRDTVSLTHTEEYPVRQTFLEQARALNQRSLELALEFNLETAPEAGVRARPHPALSERTPEQWHASDAWSSASPVGQDLKQDWFDQAYMSYEDWCENGLPTTLASVPEQRLTAARVIEAALRAKGINSRKIGHHLTEALVEAAITDSTLLQVLTAQLPRERRE